MENRNDNTASYVPRKSEQKYKIYNQEKSQKPYNDLREYLNEKRQTEEPSKKPPSEPKYNFLSDPLRDSYEKPKTEKHDNPKFLQINQRSRRGREFMRGRGQYRSNNNYGFNIKNEKQNTLEENKFYEKNNAGDKLQSENEGNSQFRGKSHTRSLSYRGNFHSRKYQGSSFDHSQGNYVNPEEKFQEENRSGTYRSRKYFPSRSMQRSHRPGQYRGSQFKENPKSCDPVNITVEYSVKSGTRKCTLDNKQTKTDTEENLKSVDMWKHSGGESIEKRNDIKNMEDNSELTKHKNSETNLQNLEEENNVKETKGIKNVINSTTSKNCHQKQEKTNMKGNQQNIEKSSSKEG